MERLWRITLFVLRWLSPAQLALAQRAMLTPPSAPSHSCFSSTSSSMPSRLALTLINRHGSDRRSSAQLPGVGQRL